MRTPATILIVDDNAAHRKLLHELIVMLGHTPVLANSGPEALASMQNHLPDLVLLDIEMPQMDGLDVLEHMNSEQLLGRIPVIMISAVDETDTVVECIKLGAVDYLVKPIDHAAVKEKVETHLGKKS